MKAIVIGGVAAGMSAASKLRRVKPDAQIVVYERGGFLSYGACGLPYYVGGFNDDPAKLIARTQAVYTEMRIETHLFHEVTRVDPERKTVTVRNLDTGAVFEDDYDVLMVATGCNSVNPKIPGADSPAVFYLKTMEDGLLLHEILRLRDVARVAVVGGGYIGLEMVEALLGRACSPPWSRSFPSWRRRSWRKTACACAWAAVCRKLPMPAASASCAPVRETSPAI